jgi:hypothetical protein
VAHAYNPSYLEGKDQKHLSSKRDQVKSLRPPI